MGLLLINQTFGGPSSIGVHGRATAVLAFAALLLTGGASSAQPGLAVRGHELVQRNCAMCHAVERTGDSPNPVAPPFRDLHLRYSVDSLAEALTEGIIVGHPQMPEFKFGVDDVKAIIRYLDSIQTLQPARIEPAPPRTLAIPSRSLP